MQNKYTMNFSWKICGLLLLVSCIHPTIQSENDISDENEDDARCEDFIDQGEVVLKECGINVNSTDENDNADLDTAITNARCLWAGLKTINIIAENVAACEVEYPNDNDELFCGIKVLVCAVELFADQCPSLQPEDDEDSS